MGRLKRTLADKSGVTLVIVICLMAVFMALSLAALLSASVLLNNTDKDLYREQARIGAVTLMQRFEKDLTDTAGTSLSEYLEGNMTVFERGGAWTYYAEETGLDRSGFMRRFELNPEQPGEDMTASIEMLWTADSTVMNDAQLDICARCASVTLEVTVCCTVGGEEYNITQTFGLICDELETGEAFSWYARGAAE